MKYPRLPSPGGLLATLGVPRYVDDSENDIDDDLDGTVDEADELDRLLANGGSELMPVAGGYFFAETEGEFVRTVLRREP